MKIAINTRFLLPGKLEGYGKFISEIFLRVVQQHPEHEFYFLSDRKIQASFLPDAPNLTTEVIFPPARHPFLMAFWYQLGVRNFLKKHEIDLFISPDGQTVLSTKTPTLTVFHDLAFEHYPSHLPFTDRVYLRKFSPLFAQQSTRVVAVSEYTKQDLSALYGVNPAQIDVVYNAASELFRPSNQKEIHAFTQQYTQGEPYFLCVGAIHPRKNLESILLAFDHFRTLAAAPVKLVIVGRKAWKSGIHAEVYQAMVNRDDVVFTGRLTDDELRLAYGAALALVYVPLFEGFGLPIVEAQRCECPVITSAVSSMPEVAGTGAVLVNPESVEHISAAMTRIFRDPEWRKELIKNGLINVLRFSWDLSAARMWDAVQKVLYKTENRQV